jgi:hypothetical protein
MDFHPCYCTQVSVKCKRSIAVGVGRTGAERMATVDIWSGGSIEWSSLGAMQRGRRDRPALLHRLEQFNDASGPVGRTYQRR